MSNPNIDDHIRQVAEQYGMKPEVRAALQLEIAWHVDATAHLGTTCFEQDYVKLSTHEKRSLAGRKGGQAVHRKHANQPEVEPTEKTRERSKRGSESKPS